MPDLNPPVEYMEEKKVTTILIDKFEKMHIVKVNKHSDDYQNPVKSVS